MSFATPADRFKDYARRLSVAMESTDWSKVEELGRALMDCLENRRQVFICGNGGSAGNALHYAIDDMQIAEDTQLIIGHMLMQWLYAEGREAQ